ncbi:hypothetical protein QR680_014468 [Steinernema hermaphroditum]|uniref:F5/8 type C domain-containing protein n=1 Tax=Steinernema hermaphroditum TaxID=289476 RepID=A0AA39I8Z2_9BILA|nr:hypothetical protein QR680_014468 [Steinernema hermaphroditum]
MFYQVWVLHGKFKNTILPLVYCLLPDKMELTYKRALQLLFDFNPAEIRRPKNIMIDFEKAEVNVIREMLPNTQVHGCYFHFSQSVWRNIKSSGLAIRYANDMQYNVHLRKFSALAFCKEQDVLVRYSQLATQLLRDYGVSDAHENFLEYFENTWVGRTTRRPRYEISMWNCKSVTELELPRTNNSVESWHNAFQGAMGSEHPNVYKLVDKLLDEQVRVKAICAKLAAGEDSPLYSRKEYEIKNRKLLSIIEAHDQMPADEYLEACVDYHHNIQFTNDGVIKIHGQQSNMLDVIWVILDAFLWLWETLSFLHRIFWRYALIVENQTKEDLFVSCAVLHEEEKDWDRAQYTFVPSTRSALFEPFPTDITGNTPLYVLTVRSKEREIYFRGQSFDVGIWKLIIKDDRETEQIARKCDILYYLLAATLAVCFFAIYRSSDFDLDSMVTFICFAVPALISLMISWFLHTKYDIIIQAHHSNQLLANSIKITGRPSCEREVANGSSQCGDSKLPAIVVGYSEPLVDAQVIVTGAGAMGPQTRIINGVNTVINDKTMREEEFLPVEPGSHTERILQDFGFTAYVTIFVEGQDKKVSESCMNHPVDYHHKIHFTNDGVLEIHGQQSNMLDVIWIILDACLWQWETFCFRHQIIWRYALIVENRTKEDLFVSCTVLHEKKRDWDRAQYTSVPSSRSALFEPFPSDITGNTPLYYLTVQSKDVPVNDRNVATSEHGAEVIITGRAKCPDVSIIGNLQWTLLPYGHYQSCRINDGNIMIQLGKTCMLGSLKLVLHRYTESNFYNYYVEMSTDGESWEKVIDNTNSRCCSVQDLVFKSRPVKYIKITGTYSSHSEVLAVAYFQCPSQSPKYNYCDTFTDKSVRIFDEEHELEQWGLAGRTDIYIPRKGVNVATVEDDAEVIVSGDGVVETSTLFNCPSIPHNLVGPVPVVLSAPHFPEIENMHQNLTMGGHGQPVHCRARHKVAIIVPYREREEHLRIFLRNIHGFLSKQQLDYTIFVVEQVPWERTFNRGKLMNIGFVEVLKMGYWPCFIFHDVDLLPENDHNLYVCANQPKHMAVAIDKYQYKLYHTTYFGGITALTLEQMVKMNGFSNEYWGWGGEDNDMYKRVHLAGYAIHRDSTEIARYKMIKHDHDEGNPINK